MTGPEHASKAAELLKEGHEHTNGIERGRLYQAAAAHAMLALSTALVHSGTLPEEVRQVWEEHGLTA